jgi:hypothetical protein
MDTPKWPSFLVEQGADVKAANNNELTPLDGAVGTGPTSSWPSGVRM